MQAQAGGRLLRAARAVVAAVAGVSAVVMAVAPRVWGWVRLALAMALVMGLPTHSVPLQLNRYPLWTYRLNGSLCHA